LWSLFLMCALPLHVWTMMLAFRDLSWLTDRTNAWDAIGVLCYGLLFALVESLLVFIVAALLGLILPKRWEPDRRIALLGLFVLVLSVWAMLEQLFFLASARVPDSIIAFLVRDAHPMRLLYGVLVVIVAATFLLPGWVVSRSAGGLRSTLALIDRLGLLAMFYLAFDAAALVIVVIRNL
jgi:hypothetical protein